MFDLWTSHAADRSRCGWSSYAWNGVNRYYFRFSDSATKFTYKHAGHADKYFDHNAQITGTGNFAGIMCIRQDASQFNTTLLTDTCAPARQSTWDDQVYFAPTLSNTWTKEAQYICPNGMTWMQSYQAEATFIDSAGNTSFDLTYEDQCGWSGIEYGGDRRLHFRFDDSYLNGKTKLATGRDGFVVQVNDTLEEFGGLVCHVNPNTYPSTMDTTDHCFGFKKSFWDHRIR